MTFLTVLGLFSALAAADCVSPAGKEGQFQTIGTGYQVCDGNAWSVMNSGSSTGTCGTVGLLTTNAGIPAVCNGTAYASLDGTEVGASCSGTPTGIMQYNPTLGFMQWCNGTNWRAMRNSAHGIAYVQQASRYEDTTPTSSYVSDAFDGSGNVAAGNTLVCFLHYDTGNTVSVVSVVATGGQALTRAAGPTAQGGTAPNHRGEIWYRSNMTATTGTRVTVTLSGNTTNRVMFCNEYSGLSSAQALDQVATAGNQPGPSMATSSVSTTTAKELFFAAGCYDQGVVTTTFGWSQRGLTYNDCRVVDRRHNIKVSVSATFNSAGDSTWRGLILLATFRGK